jgi:hypothetical protein
MMGYKEMQAPTYAKSNGAACVVAYDFSTTRDCRFEMTEPVWNCDSGMTQLLTDAWVVIRQHSSIWRSPGLRTNIPSGPGAIRSGHCPS